MLMYSNANNKSKITEVKMSDYNVGELAKVKVGRNLVDVEILECTEGYFKVKSIASGRIFESAKLEQNNNMEENIMPNKQKSLIEVAAQILKNSNEPLNCKELLVKAKESGWISTAKTPEQTLYSGIFREIKLKGENSRFRKSAQKGKFESA